MKTVQAYRVSAEQLAAFEQDGVVCLRGVFDPGEVERMREASLALMNAGSARARGGADDKVGGPRFFSTAFMSSSDERFRQFAHASVLPSVAAQMMGTQTVRFFYDQLFIKEAGAASTTPWHNDLPFWPLLGGDILSFWVALSPVDAENSGVHYVAGSHRWQTMFQAVTPDFDPAFMDPALKPAPDYFDPSARGDEKILSWDLQPGDVLVHHPLTAHGAAGNGSLAQTRIGLSIRYMGRDVQWDPRPHVMRLAVEPAVPRGAYPADDRAFPLCEVTADA
jgi:ectoine hydroxylase-related dioxygenase (phytanoyl-CoA dioxygenase family)